MDGAADILKMIVPKPIINVARTLHRDWVFGRAMKAFTREPAAALRPGTGLLGELMYGWGNETWSALEEYLVESLHQTLASEGPILECGSGLTTVLIGMVAQERGRGMWTLEHTASWGQRVQQSLDRHCIDAVRLSVSPLKDYGEFSWYVPPLLEMRDRFTLVICDGPPGETRGGRYGLLPVMREKLAPGCVVLLDDASRDGERQVAERWQAETPAMIEAGGSQKPYFRIILSDPSIGA